MAVLYNWEEIEHVELAGASADAGRSRSFNVKTRQGHPYLLMVMPAGAGLRTGNVDDTGTEDALIIKADAGLELTGADAEEKLSNGTSALFLNGMTNYTTGK